MPGYLIKVAVVASVEGGDINVDYVPILQLPHVGNAVADHLRGMGGREGGEEEGRGGGVVGRSSRHGQHEEGREERGREGGREG